MMKPSIRITKLWSDDDMLEFNFEVSDGKSLFSNNAYVDISWPEEIVLALRVFREQIYGGVYDLKAGEFGPEYANGAFLARFHFQPPGTLYVSTSQQSDYKEYKGNKTASEAKLFLRTEPVLLDRFIEELVAIQNGTESEATLQCA